MFRGGVPTDYQGQRDLKALKSWAIKQTQLPVPKAPASWSGLQIVTTLVVLVVAYFMFGPTPQGVRPPKRYSLKVPNSDKPGHGVIHRSIFSTADGPLLEYATEDVRTMFDNFNLGVKRNGNGPCLGHRPVSSSGAVGAYQWQSYKTVQKRAHNFGFGLVHFDLIPQVEGMRMLAMYSKNRPEWVIGEQGLFSQGGCTVPMYDTLGAETVEYIINQTGLTTVLCSEDELTRLIEVKATAPSLANIIQMGKVSDAQREAAAAAGVRLLAFSEVEQAGVVNPGALAPPRPEDVATFCYTSGTTGDPKGALLTHRNIISDLAAANVGGIALLTSDVHLSYLPLAHAFERVVQAACFNAGARIGFYQGSTLKIMEDLGALRPTVFPSVPRLLNKVYDKIMAGAQAGGIKTMLFNAAFKSKQARLRKGHLAHPVWDKLVFGKVAQKVGLERCRLMITGSAPIAGHVMEFLRIVFSTCVIEGYGQTESAAAATLGHIHDYTHGHVGGPAACNEVKLVSVPDMCYLVTDTVHGADKAQGNPGQPCDGRGEVCFRGHNIFAGYFKMDAKTRETVDDEGWCHSGDIGLWTPQGQLKIIDRKKNIFKLSQGEYVAAEKIENVYAKSPLVAQVFVYGDSFQSCLVGIVVPEADQLLKWAAAQGMKGDVETLCRDASVVKAMVGELRKLGQAAKLHGFEHVRDVTLEPAPFDVENGLLTPTFKLKRNELKKAYQSAIDRMYAGLGGVAGRQVAQGRDH